MRHKGQTATEYLIILAVVIVIALILIASLGGFSGFGSGTATRSSTANLRSLHVAVPSHAITGDGTRIEIQNNQPETITVNAIFINGEECLNSNPMLPLLLASGESRSIFCPTISSNPGSRYEFPLSILYTDARFFSHEQTGSLMGTVGHGSVGTVLDPVNGVCGSAHAGTFATDPPVNSRCASGSVSEFTETENGWTWVCLGLNDGEDSNECSASLGDPPEAFYALGGTIYCYNANVGDTGVVNGVTYTAYDTTGLYAIRNNQAALEAACTSHVTSFNPSGNWNGGLFYDSNLNPNINHWDTSSVTNMNGVFHGATLFNEDISNWNTSSVTDMTEMFYSASFFNQLIDSWDTSKVTRMSQMFWGATSFNQPIGSWDISSVDHLHATFRYAVSFNQDISSWDTSSVLYMRYMFSDTNSFNQDIGSWDTSSAIQMEGMFQNAIAFNQDLSSWCVSQIGAKPLNFDLDTNAWQGGDATRPQWGQPCS